MALQPAAHEHHLGKQTGLAHPTVEVHLTAELQPTAVEDARLRGTAEPELPTTRVRAVASTPSHQALVLQHGGLPPAVDAHLLGAPVAHLPTKPTMRPPPAVTTQHLRPARIQLLLHRVLRVQLRLRAGQTMRLLRVH